MRISGKDREQVFNLARKMSPQLGDIFQNRMDITPADVDLELTVLANHMKDVINQYDEYVQIMRDLGLVE